MKFSIRFYVFFMFLWSTVIASENNFYMHGLLDELLDGSSLTGYYQKYSSDYVMLGLMDFDIRVHHSISIDYLPGRLSLKRDYISNEFSKYLHTDLFLPDYNIFSGLYLGKSSDDEFSKLVDMLGNELLECFSDENKTYYSAEMSRVKPFSADMSGVKIFIVKSDSVLIKMVTKNIEDIEFLLMQEDIEC